MRCEYRQLGDVAIQFIDGDRGKNYPSNNEFSNVGYCLFLNAKNVTPDGFSFGEVSFITQKKDAMLRKGKLEKNDVVLTTRGTVGNVAFYGERVLYSNVRINSGMLIIRPDPSVFCPEYVYWLFRSDVIQDQIKRFRSGTAQPQLPISSIKKFEIPLVDIKTQKEIAAILSALDEKIAINRAINDNLQQQAMALYRQMFVETNNDARRECRADEYFDISIGKTPPRKEAQWFSMNPTDCIWVSISDMGRCGMYIADSSEYLTHESVDKFNIKVVPDNTVLLSFKLTVGRVAITDGAMATNEAIAHFKTDKPEINEYLYCYLKDFNYQTMGSTSSIATAVNSKIIKAMPFVAPTDAELVTFHSATAPMFEMIKTRQRENTRLAELRDSLLPKLMSGEIDVSAVQF